MHTPADLSQSQTTDTAVKLLWTGGWDSTYQLVRLLLMHARPVVPYYLMDTSRASTQTELRTMEAIRTRLCESYPHVRELLHPLRTFEVEAGAGDREIADALGAIRKRVFIGSQYQWLAEFCKREGIDGLELCVHVDDKVHALLWPMVQESDASGGYRSWRVDPAYRETDEYTLFRYFGFPLLDIDKLAMGRTAEREGWDAIMEMTWFCHRPARGKPCGVCGPCVYTIQEGLGRRIPPTRRMLSFFYRTLALPLKAPARALRASLRARSRSPRESRDIRGERIGG